MNSVNRLASGFIIATLLFTVLGWGGTEDKKGDSFRVFTSKAGRKIEAKVAGVFGDTANIIRRDGENFRLKIVMLSLEDQSFLAKWAKENISYNLKIDYRIDSTSQLDALKEQAKFRLKPPASDSSSFRPQLDSYGLPTMERKVKSEKRHLSISLRNLSLGEVKEAKVIVRVIMIQRTIVKNEKDLQKVVNWEGTAVLDALPKNASKNLEAGFSTKEIIINHLKNSSVAPDVRSGRIYSSGGHTRKITDTRTIKETLGGVQIWLVVDQNREIASKHFFSAELKGMSNFSPSKKIPMQSWGVRGFPFRDPAMNRRRLGGTVPIQR